MLKSAVAWTICSEGIPIMYYGTEQLLKGAGDPENRETLWTTGMKTDGYMY